MRKNFQGLRPHTTEQLRAELAIHHLIDQDDYVRGTITLGADAVSYTHLTLPTN